MKKTSKDSGRRVQHETPDLATLRRQITNLVCAEALQMVETTIEQVQNGSYQPLKYLFEMIGLYPAVGEEEASQGDTLMEILLRHLGASTEEAGS